METVIKAGDYRVDFNGRNYFVIDSAEQSRLVTSSHTKAKNKLNSILKSTGNSHLIVK